MKLVYNNKKIDIIECKSFFSRLKGFMFNNNINHALLFNRCNSIHTFFMKKNIDVIMCNRDNKIIYYFHDLGKNKIIWPKKDTYKTIELPVGYFNFTIGDEITMEEKWE